VLARSQAAQRCQTQHPQPRHCSRERFKQLLLYQRGDANTRGIRLSNQAVNCCTLLLKISANICKYCDVETRSLFLLGQLANLSLNPCKEQIAVTVAYLKNAAQLRFEQQKSSVRCTSGGTFFHVRSLLSRWCCKMSDFSHLLPPFFREDIRQVPTANDGVLAFPLLAQYLCLAVSQR
jgi:hypothetical protein